MDDLSLLTDKNFLIYTAQHYQNKTCASTTEFFEDLRRIKYIKKLITRYTETGELKERLILNHIIVLSNVFKPDILNRILYLKMAPQFKYVKPFLLLLGLQRDKLYNVKHDGIIRLDFIPMDFKIVETLRKIKGYTNGQGQRE